MKIEPTSIEGVWVIKPYVHTDRRGYFMETYHEKRYRDAGLDVVFVQDNLSFSSQGILRGLHFQISRPQAKLVQVLQGEIFDVAVDIRPGSETFGQWVGVYLSDQNHDQLFIPTGFAHGFCVLSKTARFLYKCSDFYAPEDEGGILWSDPRINIDWPIENPILSDRDRRLPALDTLGPTDLPKTETAG